MESKLLPKDKVLSRYNITPRTFNRWMNHRGLPVITIGRKQYCNELELLRFENNNKNVTEKV